MDFSDALEIYTELKAVRRKVKASPKGALVQVPDIEGVDVGKRCTVRITLVVDE